MLQPKLVLLLASAAAVGLIASASKFASAAIERTELGDLSANQGIVVDPKTFAVVKGEAKTDPAAHIVKLGAREVVNGAVIFRVGDKLYLADANVGQKSLMNAFWDSYDRSR
jgi:hypothetical protein